MCPACRLPIVGTNAMRSPAARQAATCLRTSGAGAQNEATSATGFTATCANYVGNNINPSNTNDVIGEFASGQRGLDVEQGAVLGAQDREGLGAAGHARLEDDALLGGAREFGVTQHESAGAGEIGVAVHGFSARDQ